MDKILHQELVRIIRTLPDDLRQKTRQGAEAAAEFIKAPDLLEEDISIIKKLTEDL